MVDFLTDIPITFDNCNACDFDLHHCSANFKDGKILLSFNSSLDMELFELENPTIKRTLPIDENGQPLKGEYIAVRPFFSLKVISDVPEIDILLKCREAHYNGDHCVISTDSVEELLTYAKKLNKNFVLSPDNLLYITEPYKVGDVID